MPIQKVPPRKKQLKLGALKVREVAPRKKQPDPAALKVREVRPQFNVKLPERISASPATSAFVPYVARAIMDANRRLTLTPLQNKIVGFLKSQKLDSVFMRRFEELPKDVRSVFDKTYSIGSAQQVDSLFSDVLDSATHNIAKQLEAAKIGQKALKIDLAFSSLLLPNQTIHNIFDELPPPPPPSTYDFKFQYRGITTLKAGDRSGGVEPYLIADFYRVSDQGALEEIVAPFVIEQQPWDLGDMSPDQWMPSGGTQDANGNPSNPVTIFLGEYPPLGLDRLYYSIIKVMEEDGGQGGEIAKQMGIALIGLVPIIVSGGVASVIGAVPAVIAAAVIAAIGLALEILGMVWSSSAADDPIGDILMCFAPSDICREGFAEIRQEVAEGGNDWILYFGATSTKITV